MCKETKNLAKKIINFVSDDSVIDYLNEINKYGNLMVRISRKQSLESREITIDDPELIAEYDFLTEKIIDTFSSLNTSLRREKLNKESFEVFYREGTKRLKPEYGPHAGFIEVVKFFSALIRNHKSDQFKMTLRERIANLKEMDATKLQMQIAELTALKTQSKELEQKAKKIVA